MHATSRPTSFAWVALFLAAITIVYLLACGGCQPVSAQHRAEQSLNATGTALDKAAAYTASAETTAKAVIPHADTVGVALLGEVSKDHGAAQTEISSGKVSLAQAAQRVELLGHDLSIAITQRDALLHSWGHKLQVWVTWLFWLLIILTAIHVLCAVVAPFLPPGWGMIVAAIGKWVNPLGWLTIALGWMQRNAMAKHEMAKVAANE